MIKRITRQAARPPIAELLDLIPRATLFPDEDRIPFDDLREALINDLAPSTPYEHALAENLFTLELETLRHRRLRDARLFAAFAEQAERELQHMDLAALETILVLNYRGNMAQALTDPDTMVRDTVRKAYATKGVSTTNIMAKAYESVALMIDGHERALVENESRRRRLLEDYERLKARRAKPIEDASAVSYS